MSVLSQYKQPEPLEFTQGFCLGLSWALVVELVLILAAVLS